MKAKVQNILNRRGYKIVKIEAEDDREIYHKTYPKESIKNRRFYNICGGGHGDFGMSFNHPYWTNIDLDRPCLNGTNYDPKKDISHDLLDLKPLPLESGSAELFYSQYSVEHITDEAATLLFKETFRVLKRGGIFKICCPNNMLDYLAYQQKDLSYYSWIEMFSKPGAYQGMHFKMPLNQASFEQTFLVHFASNTSTIHFDGAEERFEDEDVKQIIKENTFEKAMDIFTKKCSVEKQRLYRRDHISWWSPDKLERMLKEAGFKLVYTLSCGQSATKVMRNNYYFDKYWPFVALYVEAQKL